MALEEFTSGGARDFRQRYLDVFGFFPKEGGEILVKVTSVDDKKMTFVDNRGITYTAYADQGVLFRFIPVVKRLFFHEGTLCIAHRKPARQYQRGITYNNTTFQTVRGATVDIEFNTIADYSGKANTAKHGRILSDYLGVFNDTMYLYTNPIGTIIGTKVVLNDTTFKQEVADCLRNNKLTMEIVV